VKQYAARLGKAGLDYRAIRVAKTETAAMLADEQTEIAEDSDICSGEMDFVMDRGRDHWNCNCEHYAEQNPWKVDDPDRPEIPVHPNCMCEWRPRLKTDEEIIKAFKEEMAQDLEAIDGTQEQRDLLERIDGAEGEGGNKIISDYDKWTPPSVDGSDQGREIINEFLNRRGQKIESLEAEIDYVKRVGIAANNTKEFGSLVSTDGTIIDVIEGTKSETPLSDVLIKKLQELEANGKVDCFNFIHYHTSGCSFSFADLNAMCGLRAIKEMELATMDNGIYKMAIGGGRVPTQERLTQEWYACKEAIEKKIKSDIMYSTMNAHDIDILTSRELSRILAGIHGWTWGPPL
jgi:hypothetical protein